MITEDPNPNGWHIKKELTVGNVAIVITLVVSLAGQWYMMQAKNDEQDRRIDEVSTIAESNRNNVTTLNATVSRMDERTIYMVQSQDRIERRLEALSGHPQ